jgi:hypothetical protein
MNFADIKTLDERIIYANTSNHESLPSNFGIDATPNMAKSTFTGADGYDILNDSYNFEEEQTANEKNRKVYGKPLTILIHHRELSFFKRGQRARGGYWIDFGGTVR